MVLVCLAHFAAYGPDASGDRLRILLDIGLVASPTFMIISGMMIGLLYSSRPADFAATRIRFIDRGLFLITVGHLLILGAFLPGVAVVPQGVDRTFITDPIGLALIVGSLMITAVNVRRRLVLAITLYVASTVMAYGWHPETGSLAMLKEMLFGTRDSLMLANSFALLPWTAVHLGATCAGQWLGSRRGSQHAEQVAIRWLTVGAAAMLVAVGAKLSFLALKPDVATAASWMAYELTSPFTKRPPGPVYLLWFGGAGTLFTGALFALGRANALRFVMEQLGQLGRAALAVFIAQFYLYTAVLPRIPAAYGSGWPLALAISVAALWLFAGTWNRYFGPRVFTVGLYRAWLRRATQPEATGAPLGGEALAMQASHRSAAPA